MVVLTEKQTLKSTVLQGGYAPCVLCGDVISPSMLTAGSLDAAGRQAFACTTHLHTSRRRWIIFWAEFDTRQRHIQKQQRGSR